MYTIHIHHSNLSYHSIIHSIATLRHPSPVIYTGIYTYIHIISILTIQNITIHNTNTLISIHNNIHNILFSIQCIYAAYTHTLTLCEPSFFIYTLDPLLLSYRREGGSSEGSQGLYPRSSNHYIYACIEWRCIV